jgi:hypothetical protein
MLHAVARGFGFMLGALAAIVVTSAVVAGVIALAVALFADRG